MVYYPPEQLEKNSAVEKEIISINPPKKKILPKKIFVGFSWHFDFRRCFFWAYSLSG
jgi:hypothetical protein